MLALIMLLLYVLPLLLISYFILLWLLHQADKGTKIGKWFTRFFDL